MIKEKLQQALASERIRGAAVLFSSRSFNSLISLVFALIAGRILSLEDHGLYSQSFARIVIAQAFTEVGLQFSLVRFMAPALKSGAGSDVRGILRASIQLKFYALGLLTTFALFWTSLILTGPLLGQAGMPPHLLFTSHPDALVHLWLVCLGGFGMSILSYLESLLIAHEDFIKLSLWLPSVGLLRIGVLGLFILVDAEAIRAEHVVFAFALGPYPAAVIFFFFFPASFLFQKAEKSEWQPWIRKLFYFNLWILAASFMSILSDWMEIHLIENSDQRGLYSAARMPMQGFLILLATMQAVMLPRFSGLTSRDEFKAVFKRLYSFIIPGMLLLVPGVLVGSWFILWWYGAQYEDSVAVFWLLYPNYLLRLCFAPLGAALFALDQPRLIAVEAGLRMVAGFVLNIYLIDAMGIVGAALASLLSQFAGWAFLVYCYTRFFRGRGFPFEKKV